MGIVSFDELFPVKANPTALDRIFGLDVEGGVNRGFTIQSILDLIGETPVTWAEIEGKPSTFAPAAHSLGSHSNVASAVDSAADGTFLKKVSGQFTAVSVDFYGATNPPPPDATVPDAVRGISATKIAQWDQAYGWGNHAGQYRPIGWVPSWGDVTGKPSTFAPSAHMLGSHSDATALASATAGQLARKGETVWEVFTPDYYSPMSPPPPDATVPDFVRGFTEGQFAGYEAKLLEFATLPDGAIPIIKDGIPRDSQILGVYSENPFDPETEYEDYEAWEPELQHLVSALRIKGVPGVDPEDYVRMDQIVNRGINQETKFLIGGYWVYSGVDLIFDTVYTEVQFPGSNEVIKIDTVRINLADFPELDNATDPQFVSPKWYVSGSVEPIFGEASDNPQVPSVTDPVTEIAGEPILLGAGETSIPPTQINTGVIFAEGAPGEAALGHSGAGISNFASTSDPISGAISAEVTGAQNNTTANATFPAPVDTSEYLTVSLKVRLKAAMAAGQNLGIFFRKSGAIVSKTQMLALNKSSLDVQTIGFPLSVFEISTPDVDQIVLRFYRSSGDVSYAGYFFDDWKLQGGEIIPPVTNDTISLQGHMTGTGRVGENINVNLTPEGAAAATPGGTAGQVWTKTAEGREWQDPPAGGGTDENAVHYNAADGKSQPERTQARSNIFLSEGVEPQTVDGDVNITQLDRTSNFIIFTGTTGQITLAAMSTGSMNERVYFWNQRAGVIRVIRGSIISGFSEFNFSDYTDTSYYIQPGELVDFRFDGAVWRIGFKNTFLPLTGLPQTRVGNLTINTSSSVGFVVNGIGGVGVNPAVLFKGHDGLSSRLIVGFGGSGAYATSITYGGQINQPRSDASNRSIRRDEQALLYPITVTTAGTIHDLPETLGNFNYYLTACTEITGMAGGENGKSRTIQNHSAVNMIARHENAGSIAANRYDIIGGADLTIPPGGIVEWTYVAGSVSRYRLKSKNF